jgi:hypothetical protein
MSRPNVGTSRSSFLSLAGTVAYYVACGSFLKAALITAGRPDSDSSALAACAVAGLWVAKWRSTPQRGTTKLMALPVVIASVLLPLGLALTWATAVVAIAIASAIDWRHNRGGGSTAED